jgi:hypothetical protein
MVAANRVETVLAHRAKLPAFYRLRPQVRKSLHVCVIALTFPGVYAQGVRGSMRHGVMPGEDSDRCRFYSKGRSSGRTFAVVSAVKVFASSGNLALPPNALPCDPLFWVNYKITIRGNKEATKPPGHIRSTSSGCPNGQDRRSSRGRLYSQARPDLPATSRKSS